MRKLGPDNGVTGGCRDPLGWLVDNPPNEDQPLFGGSTWNRRAFYGQVDNFRIRRENKDLLAF
jgi:hypothetical protein